MVKQIQGSLVQFSWAELKVKIDVWVLWNRIIITGFRDNWEMNKIHKEKDSFDSRSVAISCLIITGSILFWIKQVDKEGKLRKETY